jgi:hypothetical protein
VLPEAPSASRRGTLELLSGRTAHRVASVLPPGLLRRAGSLVARHPRLRPLVAPLAKTMLRSDLPIAHGTAAGLLMMGATSNPGYRLGTTEPLVQASLERHLVEGDVLYDVGANVGFFSLLGARLVGPRGTVVAFEPLPRNVDAL